MGPTTNWIAGMSRRGYFTPTYDGAGDFLADVDGHSITCQEWW